MYHEGAVIGRVRSAAYGFTVRRNVALAKLPAELAQGAQVQVDVLGGLVHAVVAPDALYDPGNVRTRRLIASPGRGLQIAWTHLDCVSAARTCLWWPLLPAVSRRSGDRIPARRVGLAADRPRTRPA